MPKDGPIAIEEAAFVGFCLGPLIFIEVLTIPLDGPMAFIVAAAGFPASVANAMGTSDAMGSCYSKCNGRVLGNRKPLPKD